jgi:DNA-binding transcriptional ArsR family regulator
VVTRERHDTVLVGLSVCLRRVERDGASLARLRPLDRLVDAGEDVPLAGAELGRVNSRWSWETLESSATSTSLVSNTSPASGPSARASNSTSDGLGPAEQLGYDSPGTVSVPEERRETLRAASEHGYYETPRQLTVSELAEVLDVPQSTVSYPIRQAEAQLAKGYLHLFSANRGAYEKQDAGEHRRGTGTERQLLQCHVGEEHERDQLERPEHHHHLLDARVTGV